MPPLKPVDIPLFATTQLSLLSHELATEAAETSTLISSTSPSALARAGLAITNLVLGSQRTGLGGKTVVELVLDPAVGGRPVHGKVGGDGNELPEHGIRVGDIVIVAEQPAGSVKKREVRELEAKGVRGVVVRVARGGVQVAVDEEREGEDGGLGNGKLWVVKLADEVTFKRLVICFRCLFLS
jgi:DNA polymerase alpha-associated DNA helicase A